MSTLLDNCGELVGWVEADLAGEGTSVQVEPGFPWRVCCAAQY